ncbi:MAG TPA: ankyrin repeat domain-containing protein [Moraxellaceae bacterium]|nr:ankyrin repeat domain-containing protein [Moraxellaceae bacterium]
MAATHLHWRASLGSLLLCMTLPAAAALPGAPPSPPPVQAPVPHYTDAELHLLYDEAAATGAATYVFYVLGSDDHDALQEILDHLEAGKGKGARLKSILKDAPRQQQSFALPILIRDQLRKLAPGEHSGIFPLDKRNWAIVELDSIDGSSPMPVYDALRSALPKLVSSGAIPEPRLLSGDADLVMRGLMNKADTPASFDRLPPGFDIDMPLSNGLTLLQRALVRDDPAMVRATLLRAANVNLCPVRNCPLHLAVRSAAHGGDYVAQLIAAGAKPDIQTAPDEDTALTLATSLGNLEAVRQLLQGGANPDGAGGPNTPLGVALYLGRTDMAQLLMQKGANPLIRKPARVGSGYYTPMSTVLGSNRTDAVIWLRTATRKYVATRKPWQWTWWVEQDGKKVTASGNRVHLARKPFSLFVRMAPGAALRLESSTSAKFFDEYTANDLQAPLFQLKRLYTEPHDGSMRSLLVTDFAARSADARQHGGIQDWEWNPARKDFSHEDKTDTGVALVREINAFVLDTQDGPSEVPLARSTLKEVDLLAGIAMDYTAELGDLANPKRLRLIFDK